MAWTQEEHNRIVSALVITTELMGVTYSKETARFFLQGLESFPADVVLRALERGAKELSRQDFCLSAILERCRAEKRAPIQAKALPDMTPASEDDRQRVRAIVDELVRRFSGSAPEASEAPKANGSGSDSSKNPPHWTETTERE